MRVEAFGRTSTGQEARKYILENQTGMALAVSDYGAHLVNLWVPDRNGGRRDVVLGYDSAAEYERGLWFFGAPVGRHANRIKGGRFSFHGRDYQLEINQWGNNLHSGTHFYNKRFWEVVRADERQVSFRLFSPHMDQGFPGDLHLTVTYALTEENEVRIRYEALCDQDTILNLTNHSYFNLDGHDAGNLLHQSLRISARQFARLDDTLVPTGVLCPTAGTVLDYGCMRPLCPADAQGNPVLPPANPDSACLFSYCYVLDRGTDAVELRSARSGISMQVSTDEPAMVFYIPDTLAGEPGKGGAAYGAYPAVCFETQKLPDAVNHPNFVQPLCRKDVPYSSQTVYRFTTAAD